MMKTALYAGSFDPVTNGHMGILRAALKIAAQVVVAIGRQASKKPLFSLKERVELIRQAAADIGQDADRVQIVSFDGLVVDAARENGATVMIRGLRDGTDFDYEMQMAGMNGAMAPQINTILIPADPATRHISATLVRQIAGMGGDIKPFVPAGVAAAIVEKLS